MDFGGGGMTLLHAHPGRGAPGIAGKPQAFPAPGGLKSSSQPSTTPAFICGRRLYVDMTVRTVTRSSETYRARAAAKRKAANFSSVVRRPTGSEVNLVDFAGAWKGAPGRRAAAFRSYLKRADELSRTELESILSLCEREKRGKSR